MSRFFILCTSCKLLLLSKRIPPTLHPGWTYNSSWKKGLYKQKVKSIGYTEDNVPFELVTVWTYPTGKDTLTRKHGLNPGGSTLTEDKPRGLLQDILEVTLLTWASGFITADLEAK